MADPEDWIDPLNGYAYDCFNPDVLMTNESDEWESSNARWSKLCSAGNTWQASNESKWYDECTLL